MTGQPPKHGRDMPAELLALLCRIVPEHGGFGHRQHVHLAFLTVREHGTNAAVTKIARWIRHIAAYESAPQKYNATMTKARTEIVGHSVDADPSFADFVECAERYPVLSSRRLLRHHLSEALLASATARRE